MTRAKETRRARTYQSVVIVAGAALWMTAGMILPMTSTLTNPFLALIIPALVLIGMFPLHFRLPIGLNLTREKLTFTLADALVLLIAGWYGMPAAIFAAGVEGLTSSLRTVRKLSSNLFSLSIISFSTAAASGTLLTILGESSYLTGSRNTSVVMICIGLLLASIVQMAVNTLLLSTLLALRHGNPVLRHWRELLRSAAPMFVPTCSVATILYLTPRYHPLLLGAIAAPLLLTLYVLNRHYRDSVRQRILVMEKAHRETIEALAVAINKKDEVTHEHVLRVQIYAAGVARLLGCSDAEIEALAAGALLHDIGKIAVPDSILNKPGKLTASEFEKMKVHTVAGSQILGRVEFPYPIVPVVRHHHERWDGKGYPDGLKGEDIPLTARILSVVDCFDAVREDRQYRRGLTRSEAIDLVKKGSGTQYDPRVVKTFVENLATFEAEILARRDAPIPTFGIEPEERLSEAALLVEPAAGLAPSTQEAEPVFQGRVHGDVRPLLALIRSLVGTRDREEILTALVCSLRSVVPSDLCVVTIVDENSGENVVVYAEGTGAELVASRRTRSGEGVTGWVIGNAKPFADADPRLDLPAAVTDRHPFKTLMILPLVWENESRGAVGLYTLSVPSYGADHLKALQETITLMSSSLFHGGGAGDASDASAPTIEVIPSAQSYRPGR